MRRMRWAMDGGGTWDLDMDSPATMEGTAREVPGNPLPLGLSRGPRLTRTKQLNFMHQFMSSPLVPSFNSTGVHLHHAHLIHLRENWSATVMEQIHVPRLVSGLKESWLSGGKDSGSWFKRLANGVVDAFTLGFGTEVLVTPDSSLLVETYRDKKGNRSKACYHHKLPGHNLTVDATSPGLFVDRHGAYWEVPLSMAVDFASEFTGSGLSYHLCLQHNSGQPKQFDGNGSSEVPISLMPGLCAKVAMSLKKKVDLWRKKEGKIKMVQPYDVFLSDPHISGSGIIGAAVSTSLGDNSARLPIKDERERIKATNLCLRSNHFLFMADLFASVSLTMQHGNFQRLFLDLTRLNTRMDFPSGATFLTGATRIAEDIYNSRQIDSEALHALCPDLTLSLQQQIVGPISFRVDSRIKFDPKFREQFARVDETVFALDWALQVLGSARATAWYSPKRKEGMVELRFFES